MNYRPIPTIVPSKQLEKDAANIEARILRTAIACCDTAAVIKILTSHSNLQRMYIRQEYHDEFQRDLVKDLKKEFEGDFKLMAAGLVLKPMDYAAERIEKVFGGVNLNVKTLMDILAPCSREQINELKNCYKERYGKELREKVLAETSGGLRMFFLEILENNRNTDAAIDQSIANEHAAKIKAMIEDAPEQFEEFFIGLIMGECHEMLRVIFHEYAKINTDLPLDKLIELKFCGDLRVAVKALVDIVRNLPQYYAERLFKAIDCWVSDTKTIMLIITSRSEIDLGNICAAYNTLFGRELTRYIKFNTSGDFKKLLLAIIGKQ